MIVFKGYILMAKKKIGFFLMYFGIFAILAMLIADSGGNNVSKGFSAEKMGILVVDEDNSELSEIVVRFLKDNHNITEAENNKKKLYEELYYQKNNSAMVICIPKGMGENVGTGKNTIEFTQAPGGFGGIYVQQQINQLMAGLLDYQNAGYSLDEAYQKIKTAPKPNVEVINKSTGENKKFCEFFRCVPYLYMAGISEAVALIIFCFRKREVRNRMMASSVTLTKQNAEAILAIFVMGFLMFLATVLLAIARYGTEFLTLSILPYFIVNLFIDMLLALALAFLVGMLVKKENVVTMCITPISLGFSFLGGVFVALEYLSPQMLVVAKFVPVYWYEVVNNLLMNHSDVSGDVKTQIFQAYGMQFLFALAIFAAGMVAAKRQQQES